MTNNILADCIKTRLPYCRWRFTSTRQNGRPLVVFTHDRLPHVRIRVWFHGLLYEVSVDDILAGRFVLESWDRLTYDEMTDKLTEWDAQVSVNDAHDL